MIHKRLDGELFSQMVYLGASNLHKNVKVVDALNVFPVPDGDTGTNMNLTFTSGVDELSRKESPMIGESAAALAKGLLMGARGNSGVILSQLFRGFSKSVTGKDSINARQFAEALKLGVDTAYQAVMKPVEGTILTVAREAAEMALKASRTIDDITLLMEKTLEYAQISLNRTPELLPVLKEVGVVDSGGQGLVFIYEGFMRALRGESMETMQQATVASVKDYDLDQLVDEHHNAQVHMKTEDIHFGYCTEFMVWLQHSTEPDKKPFIESIFRNQLDKMGDSLLVVSDEEIVKVHIHAENPGQVLNYAQQFGSLHRLKIENMREQHSTILQKEEERKTQAHSTAAAVQEKKLPYGLIAVAAGSGIADMFKSMGVHIVVEGGQTMNPSTEDFMRAITELNAENVIILPNNSNIIMASKQAAELAEIPVAVIPTKSVPQGMAALVAFNGSSEIEKNLQTMTEAASAVKTGLVTFAVRDTQMGEVDIKQDDFIGIADGTIVVSLPDMMESAEGLLHKLIDEETGLVTIIHGEGATEEQVSQLENMLEESYPDVEVEVYNGKQPLYPFIFAVE
ncbi:DAK2 domain-containing protein [Brevibacillus ginsengisoli]|uniref:DAK2 domain-containing protein n=1 Tax=Brevibacillus ginsengisoli TaxID=363854 RepID=UPI003CED8EC2